MLGPVPRCAAVLIHCSVGVTGWRGHEGRSDVRNLLGHLRDGRLQYREVRDLERRERCAAALLDGVALDRAERPRTSGLPGVGAKRILFCAASPRVGATTITVTLAQMLAQEGDVCGAVDLSPTGELLRRLGASPLAACSDGCAGLHLSTEGGDVRLAAACCRGSQSVSALAAAWDRIPEALDCGTVLVDVSHDVAPEAIERLEADAVVAVLRPTSELCDAVGRALRSEGRAPLHFLLNGFNGRRESDRAARAALEARLGRAFLPMVIHEDASLVDMPPGTSLAERSPESQVLRDLAELTRWLWRRRG
jgi:hypothetical protein